MAAIFASYLADGGSFREEIREQFYDDDEDEDTSVEQEQKEEAIANSDLEGFVCEVDSGWCQLTVIF